MEVTSSVDQQVGKILKAALNAHSPDASSNEEQVSNEVVFADLTEIQKLQEGLVLLKEASHALRRRIEDLRPSKRPRLREGPSILDYCKNDPSESTQTHLKRIERSLSPKNWPTCADLEDLLASPVQFSALEQFGVPAQRVISAALQLETRNARVLRIRNIVIADAIDTYIIENGSVHTELQTALEHLLGNFPGKSVNSMSNWRNSGEWLLRFFRRIPLGAIFMMDQQTSMWGNQIRRGYQDPIIRYCQSLPNFISRAEQLTLVACRAVRNWARGCAYHLDSGSALGALLQEHEKRYAPTDEDEQILDVTSGTFHNPGTPEALHVEKCIRDQRPPPNLMIQRKVPDTAACIQFAIDGDVGGLAQLFCQGVASPWDVSDTRGYSLVRWALYGGMHNYNTVKFLLNQGAPVDEESYEHTWDFMYRRKCSIDELNALSHIILKPPDKYNVVDWSEEQRFPLSHKIVLGRSSKVLINELQDNPRAVHGKDAMGRTALDWAAALAELSYMRDLIDHGSPLNTIDNSGRSTILYAVDSHNDDAVRILLEAGSDPNPEVSNRSSPLIAASFGSLVGIMELLINHGAKIDACNPEGRTALQTITGLTDAARALDCAIILLDHGADPDQTSSNGKSPLIMAICDNHHDMLKLFIERRGRSRGLPVLQLLPSIAKFADTTTMSILAKPDLLGPVLLDEDLFAKYRGILRSRIDCSKTLEKAFEDLCLIFLADATHSTTLVT